ncbi:hypothetical protein CcaverHIS641_0306420 [Cutaneotrichosporon cavernicola]|nr:hypothetical protein CcaverHIS641_0306420 [Cutaneotrichosporon cavernicola]
MSGPLFSGFRAPTSFSAHRANRDAPDSMEPYRIPQHRLPSAPPPTPITGQRPALLALSSSIVAPGALTAPVRSRMAGQAAARGISIDVALGRGERGPTTGRRWPITPGRTPTSAGFPRARGLTVALLTGGGELYAESAPVTPNAGLKTSTPAAGALELVSSPGLPLTTPALTPRQEKILCRYYHTAGMTCTSSPCRFVHKIEVPPGPATAALSAVPLLSENTPDPTSGTFAAAQDSALALSNPVQPAQPAPSQPAQPSQSAQQAQPALLQIDGGVQITPGEPVTLQTQAGAELGFVYKMSGGGKGPAGKSRLKYRTVPCKDFALGTCAYGDEYCSFIHDSENLFDEERHGKKELPTPKSAKFKSHRKKPESPPADAILTPPLDGQDVVVPLSSLPAPRLAPPPRRRLNAASEVRFVPQDGWATQERALLQVHTDIPPTLDEDFPPNMGYPWSPEWPGAVWPSPEVEYSPFFPMSPIHHDEYDIAHPPPVVPFTPGFVWNGVPIEDGRPVPPMSVFPTLDDGFWSYDGYGLGIMRSPTSPETPGRQYWRTRPCLYWAKSGGRECPHGETCCFQHILPHRIRRSPSTKPNTKTVPCKFFNTAEGCTRADAKCPFAHVRILPDGQNLPKPVPFRTRPCRHFQAGRCAMGASCHFAHVLDPTAAQGTKAPPATPATSSTPFMADIVRRIVAARVGGVEEEGGGEGWVGENGGEGEVEGEKERSNSAPATSANYATLVEAAFCPDWHATGQCSREWCTALHESSGLTESALAAACEVLRVKASEQSSAIESDDDDDDELEIVTAHSGPSTRSSRSV